MNLCVLWGVVFGEPRTRELTSGETALTFDVQTPVEGRPQASVPVEWTGPASKVPKVAPGTPIAVVGSVARRFYRAGGAVQTRVYVKPAKIVVKQRRRQIAAIAQALTTSLEATDAGATVAQAPATSQLPK
jgi:single-strand DNA-binding protein